MRRWTRFVIALVALAGLPSAAATAPVSSASAATAAGSSRALANGANPCAAYLSGRITDSKFLAGKATRRLFDRDASIYQVCNGFGAPDVSGFHLTAGMQCALVAAAAAYAGPPLAMGVDHVCSAQSISAAFADGGWINGLKSGARSVACGWFSDVFAGAAAVLVAGAAAETGPGAAAVGLATWKALTAGMRLVCGGLLTGPPTELGVKLEAHHETQVMVDIVRKNKCLEQTQKPVIGIQWSAATCPASSGPGSGGAEPTALTRHQSAAGENDATANVTVRFVPPVHSDAIPTLSGFPLYRPGQLIDCQAGLSDAIIPVFITVANGVSPFVEIRLLVAKDEPLAGRLEGDIDHPDRWGHSSRHLPRGPSYATCLTATTRPDRAIYASGWRGVSSDTLHDAFFLVIRGYYSLVDRVAKLRALEHAAIISVDLNHDPAG
jgi:hypothetical protein